MTLIAKSRQRVMTMKPWQSDCIVIDANEEMLLHLSDTNQSAKASSADSALFRATVCSDFVNWYLEDMINNA